MFGVTTNQLRWDKGTKTFSADASYLRLPPGHFPGRIAVYNPKTGGSRTFVRGPVKLVGDDVALVYYSDGLGLTLKVYND